MTIKLQTVFFIFAISTGFYSPSVGAMEREDACTDDMSLQTILSQPAIIAAIFIYLTAHDLSNLASVGGFFGNAVTQFNAGHSGDAAASIVRCWGDRSSQTNITSDLGLVHAIFVGQVHTCDVIAGRVRCWGDGFNQNGAPGPR